MPVGSRAHYVGGFGLAGPNCNESSWTALPHAIATQGDSQVKTPAIGPVKATRPANSTACTRERAIRKGIIPHAETNPLLQ